MKYKQWTIEPDGISAVFVAYHEAYDPTPMNPDDPMGDPDHVIFGSTEKECIELIDEMEMTA